MLSSSGTFSWAMAATRSAMAAVSLIWEPMGVVMVIAIWPISIEGSSTALVVKQQPAKNTTRAMAVSIPTFRWWTK